MPSESDYMMRFRKAEQSVCRAMAALDPDAVNVALVTELVIWFQRCGGLAGALQAVGAVGANSCDNRGEAVLVFLPGTMHVYHMVPAFPVNCELNILWTLPVVFSVICYAKVLFIDHFMGDEPYMKDNKFKISHSDHLLNIGQLMVIATVVFYFMLQLANLLYGSMDSVIMSSTGGRLTKRLNFEWKEMGSHAPMYNTPLLAFSERFYVNP